jgi:hypothetical protein
VKLEVAYEPAQGAARDVCPACGVLLPKESRECRGCGLSLEPPLANKAMNPTATSLRSAAAGYRVHVRPTELNIINLQGKMRPLTGHTKYYWLENENIGLVRTRFHRVVIPFEPFDSGLEYVDQPESTELVVEWAKLTLDDPSNLDGVDLSMNTIEGVEASIYLGAAHNWTHLERFKLTKTDGGFRVSRVAIIEFENEGVGKNERLEFEANALYRGEA